MTVGGFMFLKCPCGGAVSDITDCRDDIWYMIVDSQVEPLAEEVAIMARGPDYRLADVAYRIVHQAPRALECSDCGRLFVVTPDRSKWTVYKPESPSTKGSEFPAD